MRTRWYLLPDLTASRPILTRVCVCVCVCRIKSNTPYGVVVMDCSMGWVQANVLEVCVCARACVR